MRRRDRGYLRKQKYKKIHKRLNLIKATNNIDEILNNIVPGTLSKSHCGYLGLGGTAKKTKAKHGHASYRHKGAYGKAKDYKKHDMQQILDMKDQEELYEQYE